MNFSQPIIKGTPHNTMLPEGTALVLEGGGTRGYYSSGVFEAFMNEGIMFPYIIGVSAGAANALSYISGQKQRSRQIIENYVSKPEYVGYSNLIKHRSLFGYDFIFSEIPQKHIFWDYDIYKQTDIRFLTGALDCKTGETRWFEKHEIGATLDPVIASCSVPFFSQMVNIEGEKYLDGGVGCPIPIEKSIEDGNRFHVIVLTRNQGYRKSPMKHKVLLQMFYGRYPRLMDAIATRHEVYNRQIELCDQLEQQGKAIIIRPLEKLQIGRSGNNIQKLLNLYAEGEKEGAAAIKLLKEKIKC